ncbi:MAG: hypothetical protein RLY31_393 [Bacteroidota bacterium]|jgi:ATP-dependent exoDNAse (exonuclease V) alpha subunit
MSGPLSDRIPLVVPAGFHQVLDLLESGEESVFLTGKAGTGKSTLLQLYRRTTRRRMVILAPTGMAALQVGGQTVHSFFGFPPRFLAAQDIRRRRQLQWISQLETIVIDEVSMLRADVMDAVDVSLRLHREDPRPFGGVQMVFVGDLFQLPPVVAGPEEKYLFQSVYDSPYFFSARAYRRLHPVMHELRTVFRQESRHFLRLLDAVRTNTADADDLEALNERYQQVPAVAADSDGPESQDIVLCSINAKADRINQERLAALPGQPQVYPAKVEGDFDPRLFPTDGKLVLKEGAQVMFVRNDPDGQFVNGTLGVVRQIGPDEIWVRTAEGALPGSIDIRVGPATWEILRYRAVDERAEGSSRDGTLRIETEVVGSFVQYPLRLAWAITIHKSQGKTFDRMVIDLDRGAFAHGQVYVALSRCRTLEGIRLLQPLRPSDIRTDEKVVDFYDQESRR